MEKIICKIIDKWDPISIKRICPSDEYLSEAIQIEKVITDNSNISESELAANIKSIFIESFGEDIFKINESKLKSISLEILELYKKDKKKG